VDSNQKESGSEKPRVARLGKMGEEGKGQPARVEPEIVTQSDMTLPSVTVAAIKREYERVGDSGLDFETLKLYIGLMSLRI